MITDQVFAATFDETTFPEAHRNRIRVACDNGEEKEGIHVDE